MSSELEKKPKTNGRQSMAFIRIWAQPFESGGEKGMCCDWLTKDEEKERLSIAELGLALYKEDLTNDRRASLIGGYSMGWAECTEK